MSRTDRAAEQRIVEGLPEAESAWLDEQLLRYDELLRYLHDH